MFGILSTLIVLTIMAWYFYISRKNFLGEEILYQAEPENVTQLLQHYGKKDTEFKLHRLGVRINYSTFLILAGAVGAWLAAVALIALNNPILAVLIFVFTMVFAHYQVDIFYRKRKAIINELAEVALQMLSGLYKVTGDLIDSLKKVSKSTASPLKEEIEQTVAEYYAGKDLSSALKDFAFRIDNRDIELFVQGVILSEHYGTDTSQVVQHVADTIRNRLLLRDELKAETHGKSATINIFLILAPLALAAIWFFFPSVKEILTQTIAGKLVITVVITVEFIAWYLTRKESVVDEL